MTRSTLGALLRAVVAAPLPWVAGCAASAEPPALWDACELLRQEVVTSHAAGAPVAQVPGPANFDWPREPTSPPGHRVADSRCGYVVGPGEDAWTIKLVARLSEQDDRSKVEVKQLLAAEGYPSPLDVSIDCSDAAFFVSLSPASGDSLSELHLLASTPPKDQASARCAVAAGQPLGERLFTYAVLFLAGAPGNARVLAEDVAPDVSDRIATVARSVAAVSEP